MKDELVTMLRALHHCQESGDTAKSLKLGEQARHVPYLVALDLITVDPLSDDVGLTTDGRLFCGIRPEGHMDLPVEVAELTGNIEERELAARYIDRKIDGVDHHILHATNPQYIEAYEHCGIVLKCIASEFRQGMHIPAVQAPNARVIPYNETNDTGVKHEAALRQFFVDVHERNVKAGWWTDIESGEPKKRNLGELLILFVTEMAEAFEAWEQQCPDDKLPEHPGFGVEMGDLAIRFADLAGAALAGRLLLPGGTAQNPGERMFREVCEIAWRYEGIRKTPAAVGEPETAEHMPAMDIAPMIDHKLAFNANRPDHKIENRLKDDGKRT
jgi:hypothetical protein